MGGLFGVASRDDCVFDLFFGTDYHSHLGTRRGGMAVYGKKGFDRSIHNIENSPFRTKFEKESVEMEGCFGIGCISDNEPQPLLIRSHLGTYAIATVGRVTNAEELEKLTFQKGHVHYLEMSGGNLNATELVAALINQQNTITEGIRFAQNVIKGSMSILVMTPEGIYVARDRLGRTPLALGKKPDATCVSFESSAYINLGYEDYKELGPGEIVFMTPDGAETLVQPGSEMKFCTFMWVYYGYPTSTYEGINVETMRYRCGAELAERDRGIEADIVAGVPDSGIAHAVGYANHSGIPFARPFIKYTPTWPRSFMPPNQKQRNLIARMKLLPVYDQIKDRRMILIDDSIVRGTQLRESAELLYQSGAKEVHIRPACPPLLFGCKYLNFSRSNSELELIARRVIQEREGKVDYDQLRRYADPNSGEYREMTNAIGQELKFTSLEYHRLDDMIKAVGIEPCKLCTYCWSGIE
ncbi:MAG: amidophosphoribosyltransferase [Oscillospiraceae bacterium]|nr:amidophosphoribosyltransferase [Oscillospiraceae bacterium]MBQ3241703.1 amidophosphoribosyltransferase [Oscillospiraceae bacterium]MBR2635767.1 amidophosphoribosyltransferase [Oscillospiraceae bacterium]